MTQEIVFLAQNKKTTFQLYALVSQYLIMLLVLTIGGYLLGRYVIIKTVLSGGIIATIGAIAGIIMFILEMLRLGHEEK